MEIGPNFTTCLLGLYTNTSESEYIQSCLFRDDPVETENNQKVITSASERESSAANENKVVGLWN